MTNAELSQMYEGLRTLREDASITFPARTTYALVRNLKTIQPIIESIVEAKTALLDQYGIQDPEQPGTYNIPLENRDTVSTQLSALDDIDNDIILSEIKWSDIEDINLSVPIMEALYPLIEEY